VERLVERSGAGLEAAREHLGRDVVDGQRDQDLALVRRAKRDTRAGDQRLN